MEEPTKLIEKIQNTKPVLEAFHLYGLHGIKDIKFDAENSASILMARNGAGKTTFLSAMNFTLSRKYNKLADISFSHLSFRLSGGQDVLITRGDIDAILHFFNSSKAHEISNESKVGIDKVFRAILSSRELTSRNHPFNEDVFEIYRSHPTSDVRKLVEQINQCGQQLFDAVPVIKTAEQEILRALGDVEIVYLPTYRRIEMSLPPIEERNSRNYLSAAKPQTGIPEEVKFGLSDITDRLKDINAEVQRISNSTYKKISANIVNDLLDGSYKLQTHQDDPPQKGELELFFTRLRGAQKSIPFGAIEGELNIPDVDKIYSDNIDNDARPFLLYFLSNLNKAIQSTKKLEDQVNGFIDACNQYLKDDDESAYLSGVPAPDYKLTKEIHINKDDFRPYFTGNNEKRVSIDALSSGEKQVVSLFARMYLYPKKKVVLYDEPELSLSMSWQAKLLPDVCKADSFSQIIAITHSPFIFDNILDQFAGNLKVYPSQDQTHGIEPNIDIDIDIDELLSQIVLDVGNEED